MISAVGDLPERIVFMDRRDEPDDDVKGCGRRPLLYIVHPAPQGPGGQGGPGGPGASGAGASAGAGKSAGGEDVVDAEFEEVKDKKAS